MLLQWDEGWPLINWIKHRMCWDELAQTERAQAIHNRFAIECLVAFLFCHFPFMNSLLLYGLLSYSWVRYLLCFLFVLYQVLVPVPQQFSPMSVQHPLYSVTHWGLPPELTCFSRLCRMGRPNRIKMVALLSALSVQTTGVSTHLLPIFRAWTALPPYATGLNIDLNRTHSGVAWHPLCNQQLAVTVFFISTIYNKQKTTNINNLV